MSLCGLFILMCYSCQNAREAYSEDSLLASAYGEQLYLSDIESLLQASHSGQDSMSIIKNYTDNWLMEHILFAESKKYVRNDKRIEDLVEDYRKSLYIHQYEESLLKNNLDTLISSEQLNDYYQEHSDEFSLKETIAKYFLVKIKLEKDSDTLETFWKTEDLLGIKALVQKAGGLVQFNIDSWHYKSDLKSLIPKELFDRISFKNPNESTYSADGYKYYVKILQIVHPDEEVPVRFYYNTLKQRILKNRSSELLSKMKNELFKEKIKNKNIKIYSTQN